MALARCVSVDLEAGQGQALAGGDEAGGLVVAQGQRRPGALCPGVQADALDPLSVLLVQLGVEDRAGAFVKRVGVGVLGDLPVDPRDHVGAVRDAIAERVVRGVVTQREVWLGVRVSWRDGRTGVTLRGVGRTAEPLTEKSSTV